MKTLETCGFSDVVWKNNWWKCSKCQKDMPLDYEKWVNDWELEILLLRKAQEK